MKGGKGMTYNIEVMEAVEAPNSVWYWIGYGCGKVLRWFC